MVKNIWTILAIIFLIVGGLLLGCKTRIKKEYKEILHSVLPAGEEYRDLFGNVYFIQGTFKKNSPDSVETGMWEYVKRDTPVILMGSFSEGLPIKEWQFFLNDERGFSSNWNIYENKITQCSFSLPFKYEETIFDSASFRLATRNDSLGKVSIIIGVHKPKFNEKVLANFNSEVEAGLSQNLFSFTPKRKELKNSKSTYIFTEFFMKDSLGMNLKLYHIYGNLPSKRHFVEFSLYHQGPKEELVKLIFNLIANNLYVDNERFYNPYLK